MRCYSQTTIIHQINLKHEKDISIDRSILYIGLPKAKRKVPVTKAREALKDPRQTLPVFWAGEATAPAYDKGYQPLAVHGAYISGVRAAEDVHAYLNDHGGSAAKFGTYYKKKYL